MKGRGARQTGFSAIAIVIAVLVVGVIAVSGVLVYQHHRNSGKQSANSNSSQTTSQQKNTTSTQPAPVTYLSITEWGVKMPLSSAISDAYYTTEGSNVGSDGIANTAWLGLASLNSTGCNISNGPSSTAKPIGSIIRVLPTDPDPVQQEPYAQLYPNGVTIHGFYYVYTPSVNITCASQASLQTIDAAFATAVKGTVTN